SIAVVIPDGDAHAVCISWYPRFKRHVGIGAITIVAVKSIAQELLRLEEIARSAVHEVDVHPSVVVVVQERAAGTHGFGKMRHWRTSAHVRPRKSGHSSRNFFECRRSPVGSHS